MKIAIFAMDQEMKKIIVVKNANLIYFLLMKLFIKTIALKNVNIITI